MRFLINFIQAGLSPWSNNRLPVNPNTIITTQIPEMLGLFLKKIE